MVDEANSNTLKFEGEIAISVMIYAGQYEFEHHYCFLTFEHIKIIFWKVDEWAKLIQVKLFIGFWKDSLLFECLMKGSFQVSRSSIFLILKKESNFDLSDV